MAEQTEDQSSHYPHGYHPQQMTSLLTGSGCIVSAPTGEMVGTVEDSSLYAHLIHFTKVVVLSKVLEKVEIMGCTRHCSVEHPPPWGFSLFLDPGGSCYWQEH